MQNKEEKIKDFIKVSGLIQNLEILFNNYRQVYSNDESFLSLVNKLEDHFMNSELTTHIVKIYDEIFSEEEIEKMTEWYSSELGKKLIEKSPYINEQVMPFIMQITAEFIQKQEQENTND